MLDDVQLNEIAKLEAYLLRDYADAPSSSSTTETSGTQNDDILNISETDNDIEAMKNIIADAESSCHSFVERIDEALQTLSELSTSYSDVTSRTNTLMQSCEDLLEQQVKHFISAINRVFRAV